MNAFVAALDSFAATDPEKVGPKAANLAALARAGLPTPGGFCLGADAYRRQIAEVGMQDLLARYNDADVTERRQIGRLRSDAFDVGGPRAAQRDDEWRVAHWAWLMVAGPARVGRNRRSIPPGDTYLTWSP